MANFELIGYIKSVAHMGSHSKVCVCEYLQGRRQEDGTFDGEGMETWSVFFPLSSRRHLGRFKRGDLVILKGTVHLSSNPDYLVAINGESIKHFYTRNIMDEIKRESLGGDETPDVEEYMESDF